MWQPCKLGTCIKFNGTAGQKVQVANNPYLTFNGPRTLEFWIKKEYGAGTNYALVHYTTRFPLWVGLYSVSLNYNFFTYGGTDPIT